MPADQTTILDYLRHGEPKGGNRYRGSGIDDPLSDKGWSQMRTSTANVHGWTRVISSPMARCRAFALTLAEERGLPVEVIDDLKEVGFGSWEGLTRKDLLDDRPEEYHAFYRDPVHARPTGAESLHDFADRVGQVYRHLTTTFPGEHLLVVAHAGVVRATLGHVTAAPPDAWYRTAVFNAAISRFRHTPRGDVLVTHNWLPQLAIE